MSVEIKAAIDAPKGPNASTNNAHNMQQIIIDCPNRFITFFSCPFMFKRGTIDPFKDITTFAKHNIKRGQYASS